MTSYERFYENYNHLQVVKDNLRPILCDECRRDYTHFGECDRCMKNRLHNREWLTTHQFVFDIYLRSYHDGHHDCIKGMPLRLPHESPFQYYGAEIEVEFDHNIWDEDDYDKEASSELAETLQELSRITDGMFVYEEDGSLENGVEMITRPMSYAYWTHPDTVEKLKAGMEYLKSRGAMVHQPTSNGLHVHTSRKFYEVGTTDDGDERFKAFDWFFQIFQPEVEAVCGRKYTNFCASQKDKLNALNVSSMMPSVSGNIAKLKLAGVLKKGGNVPRGDHYSSVNLGGATIETRVFKSTIDYTEILSYIELVRNVAHASREGMEGKTFNEILHTKENLYLDKHLAKCGLNGRKQKKVFDFNRVDTGEIEFGVER